MTATANVTIALIRDAAKLGPFLADMLTKDIPADRFARLITNNGETINANHPAYAMGHLAIYPARIVEYLGGDHAPLEVPADWKQLFEQGVECKDDPEATIYPAKDDIMAAFTTGYASAMQQLATADEALFATPFPKEEMRERFPTIGMVVNFMLTSHIMFHLGQVSTWRRCNGLGPVM